MFVRSYSTGLSQNFPEDSSTLELKSLIPEIFLITLQDECPATPFTLSDTRLDCPYYLP